MKIRLPIRRIFQNPLPFSKFQASFEAPDAVYQDKGSKQDRQKLNYDLRIHEEENSDNHQNTAGKKDPESWNSVSPEYRSGYDKILQESAEFQI